MMKLVKTCETCTENHTYTYIIINTTLYGLSLKTQYSIWWKSKFSIAAHQKVSLTWYNAKTVNTHSLQKRGVGTVVNYNSQNSEIGKIDPHILVE